MAVTRIKNNQITDATITAQKIANQTLVGSLFSPDLTLASNVSIVGNLTVTGNTSNINAINTFITDPFVIFNNGYNGSLANYTIGFLVNRNLASLTPYGAVNTAWIWSEADSAFVGLATTDTGVGITSINNSGYANIKIGNLEVVTSVTASNFNIGSATITGGSAQTLQVTNLSTGNAVISGGYISSLANATITTGNAQSWYATALNSTNGNITTLTSTQVDAGTTTSAILNATTGNITTLAAGTTTSAILNATTGNITTLGVGTTTSAILNATTGNITTGNAQTWYATQLNSTTGNITTLGVGTININVLNVTTANITTGNAQVWYATQLNSTTGNITTLGVGTTTTGILNATTGNVTTGNAQVWYATQLNSTTGNITTLGAGTTTTAILNATTGNITTLGADTTTTVILNATTGNITSGNAQIWYATQLNSTTGNITTLGAGTTTTAVLNATTGNITTLGAGTTTSAILNATTGNITSGNAQIWYATQLNSTTGNITTLAAGTTTSAILNATTGNITTLGVGTTTTATLNTTNGNITNGNATTFVVTNFSSGNAVVTGGSANSFKVGNTTPDTGAFTALTSNGLTTFTDATQSDNASSGAVVVTGGVGIGANLNVAGNVTITGNLTVLGNTTTLNTEVLNVEDLNITVAANATTGADANGAGLTVAGANATFTYLNADDSWNLNKKLNATTVGAAVVNVTTANVTTGNAQTWYATQLNSTTGNITTLGVGTTTTGILNATTGNITTLGAGTTTTGVLNVTTANVTTGNAQTWYATQLNSTTANITTLGAGTTTSTILNATTGNITTLDAGTTTTALLNATTGNVTTGNAQTWYATNLNATNGNITTLGIATINASTSNFTNGNAITFVATNFSSGNAVVTGGSINNTVIGNTTPAAGTFTNLRATGNIVAASGVNATNFTTGALVVPGGGGVGITGDLQVQGQSTFQGNINAGNIILSGNINVSVGAVQSSFGVFYGNAGGIGALYAGTSTYTALPTTVFQMTADVDSYGQVNFQNRNSGTSASTDYVATADNGDDNDGYINLGINSSTFADPDYSGYYPNDGYLIMHGIEPATGNLNIHSHNTGSVIKLIVGAFGDGNVRATVTNKGFTVNTTTASSSTTTGALVVGGGVGVTGDINLSANITAGNVIADSYYSAGRTTRFQLSDIGIVSIAVAGQEYKFGASGIESSPGIYGGTFGGSKLSLNNETNLIANRYDIVKIQTGTDGSIQNEWTFSNSAMTAPGRITAAGNIVAAATTASTSTTTGALVVRGGTGIASNITVGLGAEFNSSKTASYDFVVRGVNDNTLIWARPSSTYDSVVIGNSATTGDLVTGAKLFINTTDSIRIPTGTTAQRPGSSGGTDVAGMLRVNTSTNELEYHDGAGWNNTGTTFTVIAADSFDGDDSTTIFTLGAVATTNSCIVSINGVVQIPGTAYSVSSTSLTFTSPPATGDKIDVRRLTTTSTISILQSQNGYVAANAQNDSLIISAGPSSLVERLRVHTNGNVNIGGNLVLGANIIAGGTNGTNGQFLSSTGTGLSWVSLSASSISNGTSNVTVASNGGITFGVGSANVITVGSTAVVPNANVAINLGNTTKWFGTFYGVSTQAQYADLAENYQADQLYTAGTVLEFGGTEEVTVAMSEGSTKIAGIVSSNPAHLMNGGLRGSNVVALALIGRVPCNIIGPVAKGDMMVSAGYGYARASSAPALGSVIGKALQNFEGDKGTIEVVVGRV